MTLVLGPQVPRRGNAFSRWLGRAMLRLMGWRLHGRLPDLPKMVLIGAPHTSNMDGVIALTALTAVGLRAGTMIKDTAFRGVLGVVLRWFGALPVNRRSPKGIVEQTVDVFRSQEQFVLLIAPEGTRSAAAEWKRGFHHVARGAGVPIVPAAIDYVHKRITFGEPLTAGDFDTDMRRLMQFYGRHSAARHPERLSRPVAEALGLPWQPRADED
ncbi:1-acyl-sn-glycerol-3-phosphate acyltransferase [Sinimarinibacterium thermocellulolyticum]|uniref:1-acyl-sn-glycerol-3-phosphate acyltransferase n=1 Tax=Sinimarinibacterium thermocellulolyticum TaxID=3170016 RepID=A0ABV2ADA7_9GAMM